MARYFRVKGDNFLWRDGCLLGKEKDEKGYSPIKETKLWDTSLHNEGEYISARIVENLPEYFEEVYKVDFFSRAVFKTKEEARALLKREFTVDTQA